MQGNAIRALVESITNADNSYIRLEDEKILIRNSFKRYGAATSGMKKGERVSGYSGQGAKDALAGMVGGKICSFKDDVFVECRILIEYDQ